MSLPRGYMYALSVCQPWAWLLAHGYKDVENRSKPTNLRCWVAIHASQGVSRAEYEECAEFCRHLRRGLPAGQAGIRLPPLDQLPRGQIVGFMFIGDCVEDSGSPWFFGDYGYVVEKAISWQGPVLKGNVGFWHLKIPRNLPPKVWKAIADAERRWETEFGPEKQRVK